MLVSNSLKVSGFLEFIRTKAKLDPSSSLFLFAANKHLVKISKFIFREKKNSPISEGDSEKRGFLLFIHCFILHIKPQLKLENNFLNR